MIDYDRGYRQGFIDGVNTRYLDLNSQVLGSRLVDLLKNPQQEENGKEKTTSLQAGSYATNQTPVVPQEEWEPRPHLPPNSPEDSKLAQENPQWDFPRRPYYQDPPAQSVDPALQAFLDRQEEVLNRLESALERFQVGVQVLDRLLEDVATRSDLQRLREELGWQKHLLEEKPKLYSPYQPGGYDPTTYTDSFPGSVSKDPGNWTDQKSLR